MTFGATVWDRLDAHFRVLSENESRPELDVAALQRRLESRARALRAPVAVESPLARTELLFFRVGPELYALRLIETETVHALTTFTIVPGAPAFIRGVSHLQGEILSLLDIGIFLGTERRGLADMRRVIVIGNSPRRLALLAGEVEDIAGVADSEIAPPPRRATGVAGIVGQDRLLLSTQQILEHIHTGGTPP